jgi:hypothetical protein
MKKIIIALFVMSNILLAGSPQPIDYTQLDKIPKLKLTKLMAQEMSQGFNLPMKLDELTDLTTIYSFNNHIIFTKEVDMTNPKLHKIWKTKKKLLINYMFKVDSQNICNNPVWKYMIFKRDIIPEFAYKSRDKKPLFQYTIEAKDCKKLK